jgi:HSP20 family protein
MAIVRWDSSHDFAQLQDRLNRVFADAVGRAPVAEDGLMTSGTWVPPVDIYQNGDQELVLKAELPDMTREQIEITVDNGTLTIKGEKTLTADVREEQFHRIERRYGAFRRSFSLPQTVDPGKVSADYKHGVLTVRLPLREEAKPRSIRVDVAAA